MTRERDDFRELKITLWYPGEKKGAHAPARYYPDYDRLSHIESTPVPWFPESIPTHAFERLPVLTTRTGFPVLFFSPGLGTNTDSYTALFTELASHGYVVAAVDHTYDNRGTVMPDGRVLYDDGMWSTALFSSKRERQRFTIERLNVMAADAIFALNQMEKLNRQQDGPFNAKLDLNRVGIFGHSVGGPVGALTCQKDRRFKAAINLDGMPTGQPFVTGAAERGPEQPFLFLTKRFPLTGEFLQRSGLTRAEYEKRDAARRRRAFLLQKLTPASYVASINYAQHISFSDFPLLMTDPPPTIRDRRRVLHVIRTCARAFFDKYLMDKNTALFDRPSADYPELVVDRYGERAQG
jgi:dienelactone hydrolase